MEQNREPSNKLTLIWAVIYDKGGKNIQWGNAAFLINGVGETRQLHGKEPNWTTFSHHAQK